MWDDEPPSDREPGPQTPRAKAVLVLVVTVVMLVTVVLCCVAAGKALSLINLEPPFP